MEKYLEKERFVVEETNFMFTNESSYTWYILKDNIITEHLHLINAMNHSPKYLIFYRWDKKSHVTIYYDSIFNVVKFLPFNDWKLYEPLKSYKEGKIGNLVYLEDPTGVKKSVSLHADYFTNIPRCIVEYIKCKSFEEYDSKTKQIQQ